MIFHKTFLSSVFGVGVGLFVVLFVLELLFPGLATNLVPVPLLAAVVIVLGLATAFRAHPKPPKTTAGHVLPTAALTALTLPLVWLTLAPFGILAALSAMAAAAAVGIAFHIILTTRTE